MEEELKKTFDEIIQNEQYAFNEKFLDSLKDLYAAMTESEAIRFKKEYALMCSFLAKNDFLAAHITYSLSVRSKTLDAFFKVLGNYYYSKHFTGKLCMPIWKKLMDFALNRAARASAH